MANVPSLISLRELEEELGLERSELLLLLRQEKLQTVHKGLRTYVNRSDIDNLRNRASINDNVSSLTVLEMKPASAEPAAAWEDANQFAQLRLLRERLDLLILCADRSIHLESGELASLLGLRRISARQHDHHGVYFERYGLRFRRLDQQGQRSSWKVIALE